MSSPSSARVRVKICGLRRPDDLAAAIAGGAAYVGFVFFPPSPRHLDLAAGAALARAVPPGVARVALVVDPDDAMLDALVAAVPLDMLQLHGHEPPARVAELRTRHGLPVMKAVGVAGVGDLAALDAYAMVADQLLIDAKPPTDAVLPGGNGLAFDWRLIAGRRWTRPWMLAGGLRADTLADAVRLTGADQLDVSSGVETAPGHKDPALIAAFLAASAAL